MRRLRIPLKQWSNFSGELFIHQWGRAEAFPKASQRADIIMHKLPDKENIISFHFICSLNYPSGFTLHFQQNKWNCILIMGTTVEHLIRSSNMKQEAFSLTHSHTCIKTLPISVGKVWVQCHKWHSKEHAKVNKKTCELWLRTIA